MFKRLMENLFLKLLSLAFALILWFFVMGEQKQEISYAVPLIIKNVPVGLMVANEVPSQIDVRISGPRALLMNLQPKDISIAVDLKGLEPGLSSFKRLEERFNIPSALKVTRLSPSFVDVKVERIKAKKVPVKVIVTGVPAAGFKFDAIHFKPTEVAVAGAESELKDVSLVETAPVNIEGGKDSFTLIVPLNYRGKYTALKEVKTVEIQVAISRVLKVEPAEQAKIIEPESGDVDQ